MPTPSKSSRSSPEYRKARRVILEGNPPCHWCAQPANTLDHLIEVDRGGDHSLENLVAACKPCNSRRGQAYKTAKANRKKKDEALQKSAGVFGLASFRTPGSSAYSLSESADDTPTGHDEPRLLAMRPDSVGSFAADIVGIAKQVLGIDLMPWQVIALGGQTAFGESGKLSHRISLVSVARQNGKTTALEALVAWYLIGRPKTHGKQEVVSSAHRFDLAQSLFTGLAPRLVEHYGATAKWSHGRESLRMPDGSTWVVKAARPSAGHGLHPDLIVVDEAWDVSSDVVDGGFLPTQRARPEPLLSMWSTAGTEDSKLLQRWREEGIRSIDTPGALFFAEWSPPSGSDDDDPRTWAYANPALGKTIDLERMREDSRNPNKSAFLRGYLNQWISAELAWLPPGLWPSLEVASSTDPGGLLAVESRKDESRYFLTRGRRVDDKVEVRLVGEYRSLLEVWEVITAELDADRDLRVLLAADLESSIPMSFARRVELTGRKELMAQTRFCRAMVGEGRVRHCGSATLADHVARAVAVETAAGYTLSASKSPGPIELARCLVWLVGKLGRDSRRERPTVVVARS